jgi:hypothetical protein
MDNVREALTIINDYARSVKISAESSIEPVYNWSDAVHELSSLYAAKDKISKLPPSRRRDSTLKLIDEYLSNELFDEKVVPNLKTSLKAKTNQINQLRRDNDNLKQMVAELPRQIDDDCNFLLEVADSLQSLTSFKRVNKEDVMSEALRLRSFVKQIIS